MGAIANLNQDNPGNLLTTLDTDHTPAQRVASPQKPLVGAYVALLLFIFIYCARPKDWIPGLSNVPLAKITGILALLALIFSLRHIRHRLPREVFLLALLVGQLFLAAAMSPVWKGGAFEKTFDFAKVLVIFLVMTVAVNTQIRLRLLIFIQASSVAVIAAVTLCRGHLLLGRLEGMLGGAYSDPNDLALTMVISLPLCFALLFLSRGVIGKTFWAAAMLVMTYVVFLTGSRGGFLSLIVVTAVCLWEFAIRGRRRYLLVLAALITVFVLPSASGMVLGRFKGTFNVSNDTAAAYASSQARQKLFWRSIEVTKEHPLFGVGAGNFEQVSGAWHATHNSFTQMSSEGGVPALIFYVLILWVGFKNIRAAKHLARGQREEILLARALHCSLAGFVVGSLFATINYEFFPYMLVAYTTALLILAKESALRTRKEETRKQPGIDGKTVTAPGVTDMFWNAR